MLLSLHTASTTIYVMLSFDSVDPLHACFEIYRLFFRTSCYMIGSNHLAPVQLGELGQVAVAYAVLSSTDVACLDVKLSEFVFLLVCESLVVPTSSITDSRNLTTWEAERT